MSFKLRPMPLIVSLITSSVLLFGGWFAYQSFALQKPIDHILENIPGVEQAESQVLRDEIHIELQLLPEANLREIVHHITTEGHAVIADRTWQIDIVNQSSPALDRWWSTALFDIAQAMELKQYSDIPAMLAAHQTLLPGLQVITEMDSTHVYIQLIHENNSKFMMLPRKSHSLEVWQHE